MPEIVREEIYDGIAVYEYEEFELKEPSFFVLGLPDAGLVGGISVSHLIRTLNPREIGGIDILRMTPPIAIIKKGDPRPPLRLFAKDNMLILAAESPIPPSVIYQLSHGMLEYSVKRRIDYMVSLTGLGTPNRIEISKPKVYWAASGKKALEEVTRLGVNRLDDGILIGPYAVILKDATRYRLNSIVLLVECFPDLPDPEAAAEVLKVFSKLTGTSIDVSKLLEEAEMIRMRTKELMKHTAKVMNQMGKSMEMRPSLLYT